MSETRSHHEQALRKLGIREIEERLEVSPIITDPGSLGSGDTQHVQPAGGDGGGKHYECNIIKPQPDVPDDIEIAIPGAKG